MNFSAGTMLGPYEIVDQLGAGGMGVVYRARDARLQRDVAIKVLPVDALANDTARSRFRREGLALAKLSHPSIAMVFDVGEWEGSSCIVMECIAGRSLADAIAAGPLTVREVLDLGVEIADALEEAHGQGIIHRDLKPANVMVTGKGHAKVLDFGVAKLLHGVDLSRARTETVGSVGTPLYMSPEQATGADVDARTDIWSLGVLLYEALTGEPPFNASHPMAVLNAITNETPKSVTSRRSDVPGALDAVIMRALAKTPDGRYGSAAEMAEALP